MPSLKPFTPHVRRLFHDVFKPSGTLGKRLRDIDEAHEENQPSSVANSHKNCVALQNEDADEDAVVITALNVVPFCCHADLLLMNRDQLIDVARNLNAKLPLALKVDTARSDVFIRNSIELLVGIRHVVPDAPKANKSLSLSLSNLDFNSASLIHSVLPLTPSSPLSAVKRPNASFRDPNTSIALASLREENENEDTHGAVSVTRPQKRRRLEDSSPDVTPTPVRRKLMRSQSHHVEPMQPQPMFSARDQRVLRSRSERLPPALKRNGAHHNVTIARGRGRSKVPATVITSTPKAQRVADVGSPVTPAESVSITSLCTTSNSCTSLSSTLRLKRVGIWLTRVPDSDAREVTSGIQDMTMDTGHPSSDMDVCA